MKKIKTFNDFLENLFNSIDSGKDVYVFGYTLESDSDFQLLDENEDCDEYYTIFCLDFNKLQNLLHIVLNCDGEDYIIVNDLYNENDGELDSTLIKRMHIFKKI